MFVLHSIQNLFVPKSSDTAGQVSWNANATIKEASATKQLRGENAELESHTIGNWFQLCHYIVNWPLMSFPGLIFYNSWYKIRQVVRSINENYFILVSSIILFYIIYQVSSPVQTQGRIKREIRQTVLVFE